MDFESLWITDPDGDWRPRAGERLTLQAEQRGVRYSATPTFRGVIESPERLWQLDRPTDEGIERSAAREDLRQKVWIAGAWVYVEGRIQPFTKPRRFPVTVVDLSAGGALLEALATIPRGADLEHTLRFPLPHDGADIVADVRILDAESIDRLGQTHWQYRTRFVRPTGALRSQIARYVSEVDASARREARATEVEEPFPTDRALALLSAKPEVQLELEDHDGRIFSVETVVARTHRGRLLVHAPTAPNADAGTRAARSITLLIHEPRDELNIVGNTQRTDVVDGPPALWEFRMPTAFRKRVAREFVRWPVSIGHARIIAVDAAVNPPVRVRSAVTITNLGAGGAAFQTRANLPIGPSSGHHLQFSLPGIPRPFAMRVEVLRSAKRGGASGALNLYRCKFVGLTPHEHAQITRHIFQLQAEHRRKLQVESA